MILTVLKFYRFIKGTDLNKNNFRNILYCCTNIFIFLILVLLGHNFFVPAENHNEVNPKYKKGPRNDPGSYRPISLTHNFLLT